MTKPLWQMIDDAKDAPLPAPRWELYRTLTTNKQNIGQGVCADDKGNIYLSQEVQFNDNPDLTVTRYDNTGRSILEPGARMTIKQGQHGDHLAWLGGSRPIGLKIKNTGKFVRLPWIPGKIWGVSELKGYEVPDYHAKTYRPKTGSWQGEWHHHNLTARSYGSPEDASGPRPPNRVPIHFELIRNSDDRLSYTYESIDVNELGKVNGHPIDGKRELEGLGTIKLGGHWYWLLGMSVGLKGKYRHQVWIRRIE